jgi:hypothetical protein
MLQEATTVQEGRHHQSPQLLPWKRLSVSIFEVKFRLWHDPAHVLVGIFASRQAKLFGAFLTRSGH